MEALGSSGLKLVRESRWELVTPSTGGSSSPLSPATSTSRVMEMKTPEGITLSLHKSEIATQQVDAIVNSTTTSLELEIGALSASILNVGGDTLQEECDEKAPDGIELGEVIVTSGGQLPCQFVVHGAACSWADEQCTEILGKFVANSLSTVHNMNLGSIAIPAIGTGVHSIPPEVVAKVMLDELCKFIRLNTQTQLREVRFVVYIKDDRIVQAFEKVLLNRCFAMTVETTEGIQLSLRVSDLADEKVDAIVNSAGTELRLNVGAASKTLVEKGGKTLQEECDIKAPSGIKFGDVLVTSGGQLRCQYVMHGACCYWTDGADKCKQILGEFLTNTFKAVHDNKLESVAFPAIGTGALQIPPRFVGKVMIHELLKFSHQHKRTTLKDIRVMLYFKNRVTMQAFRNVLRESCTILPVAVPALNDAPPARKAAQMVLTKPALNLREVLKVLQGREESHRQDESPRLNVSRGEEATHSNPDCVYWKMCRRYFQTLDIQEDLVDSAYNTCYCSQCHSARKDKYYYTRGQPAKTYGIPVGWCRIGLQTPPQAKAHNSFATWHRAFHGTEPEYVACILAVGHLLVPGDVALGGIPIGERPGHYNDERKPARFNTKKVFLSPSILYSGCDVYATPSSYVDKQTQKGYESRVAFQVLIAPDKYEVGAETIGALDTVDPKFSNDELEWSTEQRGSIIIYGLLVRLEETRE